MGEPAFISVLKLVKLCLERFLNGDFGWGAGPTWDQFGPENRFGTPNVRAGPFWQADTPMPSSPAEGAQQPVAMRKRLM